MTCGRKKLIYIAGAYTANPEVFYHVHEAVLKDLLLSTEYAPISPIVLAHGIAKKYKMPKAVDFWLNWNKDLICVCSALGVIDFKFTVFSRGVELEKDFAKTCQIPIYPIVFADGFWQIGESE
jgi:hypothetical protein